ncbi:hypothetical protein GCM10028771_09720 [Nocardioides marmoraquaticus]
MHARAATVVVLLDPQAQRRRDRGRDHFLLTAQFSHATTLAAGNSYCRVVKAVTPPAVTSEQATRRVDLSDCQ